MTQKKFTYQTTAECRALIDGIEWVNDSAVYVTCNPGGGDIWREPDGRYSVVVMDKEGTN